MKGSNRPLLKKQNAAHIKEVIYRFGPISRSEIAEKLSLTPPTITIQAAEMLEAGILLECEPEAGERGLGRRPIMLDLNPSAKYAVGIELGPYQTVYAALDLRGAVIHRMEQPRLSEQYSQMLGQVFAGFETLVRKSGVASEKILGIGIGVPGFIDEKEGLIRSNLRPDWAGRPLAADMAALTGRPVRALNNVRARAMSLAWLQRDEAETFLYYYISHGIACPQIAKGEVLSGETGGAGEAGHMIMDPNGDLCEVCGQRGCLESLAGEGAILRRVREGLLSGAIASAGFGKPSAPSMTEVLQAQCQGEKEVCAIVRDAVIWLGVALANIINLTGQPTVIVDGYLFTLTENRDLLMDTVRQKVFGIDGSEVRFFFKDHDFCRGAVGAAGQIIRDLFIRMEAS